MNTEESKAQFFQIFLFRCSFSCILSLSLSTPHPSHSSPMQKSLNRKSSNDASQPASGSGSSISKVLSRNLSLRGKQRKQGSTSGLNGCFKVAVISERNVPISELLVVIKKTCKLTRRRFQDQVAVQLRSDEMDVYKYCKCELPEETALTSDINHTGK
jgi:hypothetical protein